MISQIRVFLKKVKKANFFKIFAFLICCGFIGVGFYLVEKNAEFIIPKINQGSVASVKKSQEATIKDFSLSIPKTGIKAPVILNVDGYNKREYFIALEKGVAHLQGTALPGEKGNLVIFGHSSYYPEKPGNYKDIFKNLEKLEKGDLIELKYNGKRDLYVVFQKEITSPKSTQYLAKTSDQRLTLITCVPPGTTKYRLVIIAKPKKSN